VAVLGYAALIRLAPLRDVIEDGLDPVGTFLGPREEDLWVRCVTQKRKVEFLGGRIAGKLAANMYRVAAGTFPKSWNAVEIFPQGNGRPVCEHDDGLRHSISISHSSSWALALVSSDRSTVAVDIEDSHSRVRPMADMFHEVEISQIRTLKDARLRWTLKEVYGKLTGWGVQGLTRDIITLRLADGLWLAIPPWISMAESSILAVNHWGPLTVAIGVSARAQET